jgi:hypothetical protein
MITFSFRDTMIARKDRWFRSRLIRLTPQYVRLKWGGRASVQSVWHSVTKSLIKIDKIWVKPAAT